MKDFAGKIAVITGGGTGMGRELARQLVAEGCHVALCDVSEKAMAVTRSLCEADAPQGTRVSTYVADVSKEDQILNFRDHLARDLDVNHIHLLFNNAGVGGGGSIVTSPREEWERTFNICWGGVYFCTRAFLPMLQAANEAHIINTSSVNGFWASLGPGVPHTAYSAAKFAVKGFTEALITDLAMHAPHVNCSVVMPGHIGTEIAANSRKIIAGTDSDILGPEELARARRRIGAMGMEVDKLSDADIQAMVTEQARRFHEEAPTSAAQAATIILDGVKAEQWRILVGDDAHYLDALVRAHPENAYDPDFFQKFAEEVGWRIGR